MLTCKHQAEIDTLNGARSQPSEKCGPAFPYNNLATDIVEAIQEYYINQYKINTKNRRENHAKRLDETWSGQRPLPQPNDDRRP